MASEMVHVAAAVLVRGEAMLVARRVVGAHLAGTWEFPGGKIESEETPANAVRREVREEVGLEFEHAEELVAYEHAYDDRTVRLTFFLCSGVAGIARGREGQELRWVDLQELESLPTPPANAPVLAELRRRLNRRGES